MKSDMHKYKALCRPPFYIGELTLACLLHAGIFYFYFLNFPGLGFSPNTKSNIVQDTRHHHVFSFYIGELTLMHAGGKK